MLHRHGHLILTLLIAAGIIVSYFGEVLADPNGYMFSSEGDGLKNYFTFSYHLAHGDTATNFGGMNYPYGEHIMYTDGHPLLAGLLRPFGGPDSWVGAHAIGILNVAMLLGLLLTFLFSYLLFVQLGIRKMLAMLFAVGVGLLVPQLFRLEGHYALSYGFAFPLSWWLLLRAEGGSWKWLVSLALNHLVWMGTHAYLGVMTAAFSGLILLISSMEKPRDWKQLARSLSAVVLPVVLFMVFVQLTDVHPNRTSNPSGLFLYNAEVDDLFVPHHGPIRAYLETVVAGGIHLQWEAWAYVGISGLLMTLFLLASGLMAIFKEGVRARLSRWVRPQMRYALVASCVLLLFAMGVPYRQFPEFAEWFPVLKQFRGAGRFDWPFWWVLMVFLAAFANRLFERERVVFKIIPFLAAALLIWEGSYHFASVSEAVSDQDNLFETPEASIQAVLKQVDTKDYQCLLPLPFYHAGSETFTRPRTRDIDRYAVQLSQLSGLPAMSAVLTRISIDESRSIFQALSPFGPKSEFPLNAKPILILTCGQELNEAEQLLLKEAETVIISGDLHLHRLEASALNRIRRPEQATIEFLREESSLWFEHPAGLVSDSTGVLWYNGFESSASPFPFHGKGGFAGEKKGETLLATFGPNHFQSSQRYDLSVWMRNREADALNLYFPLVIQEIGPEGEVKYTEVFPDNSPFLAGDWSLVETSFDVSNPAHEIRIVTKGKDNSKAALYVDELLIRKHETQVFKEDLAGGRYFWNNWVWKTE